MSSINDFMKGFMSNILKDGTKLGDSIVVLIDDEHRKKVSELINTDTSTFYALKEELGIDLYGDEYYSSSEIQGLHPDHFLLSTECEDRIDEFRQAVYQAIDYFYENRVEDDYEEDDYGEDDYEEDVIVDGDDDDYFE